MKKPNKKRPKVSYDTPGRVCAHADSGCCPKCEDPMVPEASHLRRHPVNKITKVSR